MKLINSANKLINEGGDGFNPYRAYLEEHFHEPIPMNKDLETKPDY